MYDDPELLEADRKGLLVDERWNPYDPYNPFTVYHDGDSEQDDNYDYYGRDYGAEPEYLVVNTIQQLMIDVESTITSKKEIFEIIEKQELLNEADIYGDDIKFSSEDINALLYILRVPRKDGADRLLAQLKKSIIHPINALCLRDATAKTTSPELYKILLLFSPYWIRSPLTWNETGSKSIIDHLFVRYETPQYLYKEWYKEWYKEFRQFDLKWLSWFLIFAQGSSLKQVCRKYRWNIPARCIQYLYDADEELSPVEALLYARVKHLKGSDRVFRLISNCPSFLSDLSNAGTADDYIEFWEATVVWLTSHENDLTDLQANTILDWAMHEFSERDCEGIRNFSWSGRSLNNVLEQSVRYQEMIHANNPFYFGGRSRIPLSWKSYQYNWEVSEEEHEVWSFIELSTTNELFEEGRVLKHCVASYYSRCIAGNSAIVSLRLNRKRKVTIEVNPSRKMIVQVCGLRNRQPTEAEKRIVNRWYRTVVSPG
jgi:hypothetical protein